MRPEAPGTPWGADGEPPLGPGGHLDEAAAHAFVDGAYPDADAARVVLHLRECPACAALVADARGLVAAAAGVLRKLDDGPAAIAGVTPVAARPTDGGLGRGRPVARRMPPSALRAAAAALIVAGLGGGAYVAARAPQVRAFGPAPAVAAADSAAAGAATTAALAAPAGAPTVAAPAMAPPAIAPRAMVSPAMVPRPAPRAKQGAAAAAPLAAPSPERQAVAASRRAPSVADSGVTRLDADAVADAASPARRPLVAPSTVVASRGAAPGGTVRSDRRVRRSGAQLPDARGCYDVAGALEEPRDTASVVALPSPVRLGDDGQVIAGGTVRGAWALVAADSLRVRWTDAGGATVMLRYDGARWAGSGVRLTPSADAGACGEP